MSKSKQSERVLNLPAGYFGMVLGIIGMGFAWRYASQVWPVSHWIGDGLVILAMVIWGLLTLAFISRLLRFPHSVLAEIRHPVMSSFVSLFPATTMLVATAGDCVVQHRRGDTAGVRSLANGWIMAWRAPGRGHHTGSVSANRSQ